MKRSPLPRTTPLKRRKPIVRQNGARVAARFRIAFGGDHAHWIRPHRCAVEECLSHLLGTPIEAAHVKSRGAGGTARHLVPLCAGHHREQHQIGIVSFQERYQIDLHELAERFWRESPFGEGL